MIRMHNHPNGQTELAAFCDTCGHQIREHGFLVWSHDPDTGAVDKWRVIHQGVCDPGLRGQDEWPYSMDLDVNLVYLANSAGVDLEKAAKHVEAWA